MEISIVKETEHYLIIKDLLTNEGAVTIFGMIEVFEALKNAGYRPVQYVAELKVVLCER